ncbi:hypothetical protein OS493_011099, partial [Desmophyllum pertusum]
SGTAKELRSIGTSIKFVLREMKIQPAGRPDVLYFLPEADGKESYLNEVPIEEVDVAMDVCCEEPGNDISESLVSLREF